MSAEDKALGSFQLRGIRAFEQNEYAEAVRLWSTALGLNEGDAAATLCNRSSAYTHQGLWIEALIDARQAMQMQPDGVKVHYRLAQAYSNVGQYQQCHATCQAALEIKPRAEQLMQLRQLAEDMIRSNFMTYRNCELGRAIATVNQAALQQESQSHQQHRLQKQILEDRASANTDRRHAHILQEEAFLQWHSHHHDDCDSTKASGSADQSYKLLGVAKGATVVDIRLAYVRALKKAHPDKGGSIEQFHKVQAAYHQLTNTH